MDSFDNIRIWKISAGSGYFNREAVDRMVTEGYVSMADDTAPKGISCKSQWEEFKDASVGDICYLCHGNQGIKALGFFTAGVENFNGKWKKRKVQWLFKSINPSMAYSGETKWWTPSDNSTFIQVPKGDRPLFENWILSPFFQKTLTELKTAWEINFKDVKEMNNYVDLLNNKKNIILQGAPGTGKTYTTASLALSMIGKLPPRGAETDKEYHKKVMDEYEKQLIEFDDDGNVTNGGQIGFVTFHQSMDYEDFVEGIKPQVAKDCDSSQVQYNIFPGIFKSIVKEAKFAYVDLNNTESKAVEEFDQKWTALIDWVNEEISNNRPCGLQTKNGSTMKILEATDNMIAMQGESAQNSTTSYRVELKKLWDIFGKKNLAEIENFNKEFRKYVGGNCTSKYAILKKMQETTVVASNSVQIENCSPQKKGELISLLKNDDFKKDGVKNYVLIIDEINRGNVSKIFGELISLLEADKRAGGDHPLTVTLPYSKEQFSVPSNLYIIGTMNTTDRSVGSIDYAVRRRFAFVTLPADENLVPEGDARNLFNAVKNFLDKSKYDMEINDLMVGHSYFMDADNLQMKWQYEILPLLMEYHKDGIISKSPLKDSADKEIADVKKNYANFITAWEKPNSETSNS